jgi:hypothetical protein
MLKQIILNGGSELNMSGHKIVDISETTNPQDVTTMKYVDSVLARKKSAVNYSFLREQQT